MRVSALGSSRRQFLQGSQGQAALGLVSGCGVLRTPWQPAKIPRIGYLANGSPGGPNVEAFLEGLRELGYVEAQNISIEWRFAEGRVERLPQLVAELIGLPVDLILAAGPGATLAAKNAPTTMPIVMCFGGDPIGLGLIASLAQPGSNVTGLAALTSELGAKRLELFTEALPGVSRVAVLWDPNAGPSARAPLDTAARSLHLKLQSLEVRGPDDFDGAFEAAVAGRAEALFVAEAAMFTAYRGRLADLAARSRLPATAASREFAEAGALLTYGASFPSMYRRAATYVDKILKGAKPADLPVEQPTTFDFVINLKTTQALGLTIPQSVLQQATEVLQ